MNWQTSLALNEACNRTAGSKKALREAIDAGADLRIYTSFRYNEHIDTRSSDDELVDEVSEFRVTYLVDNRWAGGIMSQRMPIEPPHGFGPRPSMSFFLYNEDGSQAIARPYLDGIPACKTPGASPLADHSAMPRYEERDRWDDGTNAPSSNFCYRFGSYRFLTRSNWQELYSHEADGSPRSGSLEGLREAFCDGAEIKVGVENLCADLAEEPLEHTVFVQCGPGYYHRGRQLFCAGTQPVVRVAPGVPLCYRSGNWDFGWLFIRTDGAVEYWRCDPYTLAFSKQTRPLAVRWFAR